MMPVRDEDIGGAFVRRRIDCGNRPALVAGQRLSRDEVLAIPVANRRALVATERLWLLPKKADLPEAVKKALAEGEAAKQKLASHSRILVQVAKDRFDVIEGAKLNEQPLSKEAAEELATRPAK